VPVGMPGTEYVQQRKTPAIYAQSGIQAQWMSVIASLLGCTDIC
jgi:hypothetical protein